MTIRLTRKTSATSTATSKSASATTTKIVDKNHGSRSSSKINKEFIIVAEKNASSNKRTQGWGSRSSSNLNKDFLRDKGKPNVQKGEDCLYNLPPHAWSLPVDRNTRLSGGIR